MTRGCANHVADSIAANWNHPDSDPEKKCVKARNVYSLKGSLPFLNYELSKMWRILLNS
jgi:hypothetical protein